MVWSILKRRLQLTFSSKISEQIDWKPESESWNNLPLQVQELKKTHGLKNLPWVPQETHAVPTIELVMKMAMEKNAEEELFWFRKYYERDAAYLALIDSFIQVYKYTLQERVGGALRMKK